MTLYGYGKILDVDLATGKIFKTDVAPNFAREYIGGMGFSCRILYDAVGPEIEPLGPDNILIFANGPLTGTKAPCAARTEITTKSPLNDGIGTGNTGGLWGTRLKHAGYDVVIIRNQAESPVYLWLNDDMVEIREAGHLWGKDTHTTSDMLAQELVPSAPSQVSVLAIGPAGENVVRYACPINDYHHCAARSGSGAVMGTKKLKAIAVRGTGTSRIARPEQFREAVVEVRERLMASDRAKSLQGAAPEPRLDYVQRGCVPAKNFQTGILHQFLETRSRDVVLKYFTHKEGTCYGCPISCFDLVEVKKGKYAGVKVSRGAAPGVAFHWGATCAIDNLPAIWKCKELCHQLGMDYASTAGCIAFATELFQRGIITARDTDGLELIWGNDEAVVRLLHRIAFRDGFGDVLAEGSRRAAKIIGAGAEKYVMTTKGVEMMSADPRSGPRGWIFGDLTNPRGGDNVKSTHSGADRYNPNWWVKQFDIFEDVKRQMYCTPPEEVASTWEGKATICRWFEDLYSILNALGICFFTAGMRLSLGPTGLAKLFSACTGWDTTPEEIMKSGERIFTVLKAYTARQGLTRKDDTWPDRFFEEPLPDGPARGAVLSRQEIDSLLDEYYELRGWDKRSGLPTAAKLVELGLGDIAHDLRERDIIPD